MATQSMSKKIKTDGEFLLLFRLIKLAEENDTSEITAWSK